MRKRLEPRDGKNKQLFRLPEERLVHHGQPGVVAACSSLLPVALAFAQCSQVEEDRDDEAPGGFEAVG